MRILALLAADPAPGLETKRLCQLCADLTGASGAGIMLMAADVHIGSLCSTDSVSALIEQLQYDLGERPCVDAHTLNHSISEPDLAEPSSPRWLAFSPPALKAGKSRG